MSDTEIEVEVLPRSIERQLSEPGGGDADPGVCTVGVTINDSGRAETTLHTTATISVPASTLTGWQPTDDSGSTSAAVPAGASPATAP